ncbi:MAG: phosphoglucosamine mutase, partial [Methylophilaceae bacterium]|nr:phosphoglucosamine mutase [Methylophilaceae bacterium]
MKTKHYFGTDGIRGTVGVAPITPDFVMRVGYAVGRLLVSLPNNLVQGGHPSVLIGKDTRISGYMLESALEAGLIAAGADVLLTGPLPTPAVAYLTRALRAQAGIVISASHNLYNDNGLKFFSSTGHKLDDHLEQAIEEMSQKQMQVVSADKLGKAKRLDDATGRYVEFCKSTFPSHLDLRGLKIMVDCAHGATYHVAPPVLHELGAEVIAIHNTPDGFNINRDSGTIAPQALREAMLQSQADVGIAFDGDGDRLLMVDAEGNILTGDGLLYIIA